MGNKQNQPIEVQPDNEFRYNFKDMVKTVSILSYNILAECYAEPCWYPHTNPAYLSFSYRSKQIVNIISNQNPDFFTLQECDHYDDFYGPHYEDQNQMYAVTYTQRNQRDDGLLVGFKKSKYELKDKQEIFFDDIAGSLKCEQSWFRQNIAIICEFIEIETGQSIVVVTTHLYWDPRQEHIKYHQMLQLNAIINQKYGDLTIPILFTGDFNSLPTSNSVQFLLNAQIPNQSLMEMFSLKSWTSIKKEYDDNKSDCLIPWKSAYQNYRSEQRHPEFTNYTVKWQGTIDHIFYRENQGLTLRKILDLPTLEQVTREVALPNKEFPSDHLPIMAEFQFTNNIK